MPSENLTLSVLWGGLPNPVVGWGGLLWFARALFSAALGWLLSVLSLSQPFAFYGEPRGAACPAPLSDPPGHPTTRPFGFAALLDLSGSHKTRRYAPQTSYDSFSR